jgi:transcriptional regulator GlxA family with amidase domain
MPSPRTVVILAFPGVQSLDVTGPLEVFSAAQTLIEATGRADPGYEVVVVSCDGASLPTSSGLQIAPRFGFAEAPGRIDTLIVAGGPGSREAGDDPVTVEWIGTSAGVTAGMDLALALVEEDLDRDAALTIARHLVLFLRRPGNQSQFSATLATQEPLREPLREVRRHIVEHPGADLSVQALAERAHMSPRHFARSFRAETGVTPARYVESVRLEAARRALEDGNAQVAEIARACGFGTAETMRRAFLRALAVAPAEYRRRFHPGEHAPGETVAA